MREDAVEFVEAVVANDELAAPLRAMLKRDPGAQPVGEVLLEPRDVRVGPRRFGGTFAGLRRVFPPY